MGAHLLFGAFVLGGAGLARAAAAATMVPAGSVSGTWTAAEGPYLVTDNITVFSTDELTIEAGTVVRFAGGGPSLSMQVYGKLTIDGDRSNLVVFEAETPLPTGGGWQGIRTSGNAEVVVRGAAFRSANTGISCASTVPTEITESTFEQGNQGIEILSGTATVDAVRVVGGSIGVMVTGVASATVSNSIFVNQTLDGVAANVGASLVVQNCTFDRNMIGVYVGSNGVEVRNALFSNNTFAIQRGTNDRPLTLATSGFWQNTSNLDRLAISAPLPGTGHVMADPRYVSATDLHLTAGSPLIDVGSTIAGLDHDFDLAPRPRSKFDIGAYEFAGTVSGAGGNGGGGGDGGAGGGRGGGGDGGGAAVGGRGGSTATGGSSSDAGSDASGSGGVPSGAMDAAADHGSSSGGGGCSCRIASGVPDAAARAEATVPSFVLAFVVAWRRRRGSGGRRP